MMKIIVTLTLLFTSSAVMAQPAQVATTCEELEQLSKPELAAGFASMQAFVDCANKDPGLHLRFQGGYGAVDTTVGNTYSRSPCQAKDEKQCPNNARQYTDGIDDLSYVKNPDLNGTASPISEVKQHRIPCGAIASFSTSALQGLLGGVKIAGKSINSHINDGIGQVNSELSKLQSTLNGITPGQQLSPTTLGQLKRDLNNQMDNVVRDVAAATGFPQGQMDTLNRSFRNQVSGLITQARSGRTSQSEIASVTEDTNDQVKSMLNGLLATSSIPDDQVDQFTNQLGGDLTALSQMARTASDAAVQQEANRIAESMTRGVTGFVSQANGGVGDPKADLTQSQTEMNQALDEMIQKSSSGQPVSQSDIDKLMGNMTKLEGHLNTVSNLDSAAQGLIRDGVKDVGSLINNKLTGFIGNAFKYKNCQQGQFWGILSNVMRLAMGKGNYRYNVGDSSFITQGTSYLTLPKRTKLNVPISQAPAQAFELPLGGKFRDSYGRPVRLNPGEAVKFRKDGLIRTSRGDQYRVHPGSTVELDPNDIIKIPAGTKIPVGKEDMIYPVGSASEVPDWLNEDYTKR